MDPNKQNRSRSRRPVSAARGSEDQPLNVPPEDQQLPVDLSNYAQQEVIDLSCLDTSTEKKEHDPATDPMIAYLRDEVDDKWYEGKPNRSISREVFQGMTIGTNKAFNEINKRFRDSRPFEVKFPGYVEVRFGKDPRWLMSRKKRYDLYKTRRIPERPVGSEGRGVMMPYRRGNLALAKKRARESRQRSKEVMRAMKREKDKGRARQLLMRSKALLQQRLATRPNPEVMQRYQRKKAKKQSWKGMAHRQVYQRSPYKVHSQNISMVKNHMHKRRQMAQRGIPSIWNPQSKLGSKRDINPISVQTETGYDISRVRSLPPTLEKHLETEIFQPVYQMNTGPQYFPATFRGFPPRPIPRPFLLPDPRLTTPPASPIPSSASSSGGYDLSDSSSSDSSPGSSTESSSDEYMQIEDTDADTEMED